jgi:hypothetical protein
MLHGYFVANERAGSPMAGALSVRGLATTLISFQSYANSFPHSKQTT